MLKDQVFALAPDDGPIELPAVTENCTFLSVGSVLGRFIFREWGPQARVSSKEQSIITGCSFLGNGQGVALAVKA